jgi:hypothetical protein
MQGNAQYNAQVANYNSIELRLEEIILCDTKNKARNTASFKSYVSVDKE